MKSPKGIVWNETLDVGFYPVYFSQQQSPYDRDYFKKYQGYADTEMGRKLDISRVNLVERHAPDSNVVDIGIGSGNFIEVRKALVEYSNPQLMTYGYDVNPHGIRWLLDQNRWWDPWQFDVEVATFWDSLEHFFDPRAILSHVNKWAFVSIPIFRDPQHADSSKHFRPTEHYHYFTKSGFIKFMDRSGFQLAEFSTMEVDLGREDIGTFAFKRAK